MFVTHAKRNEMRNLWLRQDGKLATEKEFGVVMVIGVKKELIVIKVYMAIMDHTRYGLLSG